MGIEPERVVQVRTPGGIGSKYRFGSGYLVADGLILTARHVLVRPESDQGARPEPGQRCEISFGREWLPAVLEAAGDIDAAVLRTDHGSARSRAGWAHLAGSDPLHWYAVGYPYASMNGQRRDREQAFGWVAPLTGDGDWLGLTVKSRAPRTAGTAKTGWAGLSGAAVICEGRIAGVITDDPVAYDRGLKALRATAILADPALSAVLGRPPVAEIGGPAVRQPPPLEEDRPVLLIVDDEDADIIGEPLSDLAQVLTATNVPDALALIADPTLRIDAALVDICLGEETGKETGESGRSVLRALREHRPRVPRSVISADPLMGLVGDITGILKDNGVHATLKKPGPGTWTPGLRACTEKMLQQDDDAITAIVTSQLIELRKKYVQPLNKLRNQALHSRRHGDIDDDELEDAESRVKRAEDAVADALDEAASAEADAKWDVVDWLRCRLEKLSSEAG